MAEKTPFSPLDPLGPEYGTLNAPIIDKVGLSPFEGNILKDPGIKIAPPSLSQSLALRPTLPNRSIEQNVVKTNANNSSIPPKPLTAQDARYAISNLLKANVQSTIDPNQYAKIYSYDSGPDGNAFYKRYHAYGQETFDKIGFSPLRDNESIFNDRTTRTDDFVRMLNYSFVPLLKQGFVSGPKSLIKMMQGDFTSSDREDARIYEEAAAIGQSSKGGAFGFTNNLLMNFAYTGGIMGEAIIEELGAALLAAPTGGASFVAGNLNIVKNLGRGFSVLGKAFKSVDTLADGTRYIGNALSKASTMTGARQMWNAARNSEFLSGTARMLNPLENSFEAIKQIKGADNISNLALLSKTAGGLYRDVRKINMALAESRLEAGMVENHVYDKLYRDAFLNNGNNVPSNKELADLRKQAKDASIDALTKNLGLIYVSNAITFDNITGPKGGLRNFIKSTTDDVVTLRAAGKTDFGTFGKVVYDRSKKAFELQKNSIKQLAKNWYSNPGYKTLRGTVGYFKANFTEGLQEIGQEIIAEASEKYYIDAYKNKTLQRLQYGKAVNTAMVKSKLDYYTDALGNQMSAQGLETFGSGFFMGFLAAPVNGAIPFLSAQYNRMYNKEEYERWKKMQQTIGEGLVKELNNVSLKEFFHDHNVNAGAQDVISKIRSEKSKKEGLDADLESMVRAVSTMRSTGTTDMYVEKLKDLSQADDKEFADALNIEPEKVEKYRGKVNDAIAKIKDTISTYEAVEKKYPLPFDKLNIDPKDKEGQAIALAWENAIHNIVFFNKAYENAKQRRSEIINKWQTNSSFSSVEARDKDLLFEPEKIYSELSIINNEIVAEKETTNNQSKIDNLEARKKSLTDFLKSFETFNSYFNRADAVTKRQQAGDERTIEEIAADIDAEFGSLEDPIKKENILNNLKQATEAFIQTTTSQKGEKLFTDDLNLGFELLVDYYKLGDEYKRIGKYIDLLDNPDNFLDLVQRNAAWMKKIYDNRAVYNKEVIANELDNANLNSLLNNLANEGVYLSAEELEALKTKGLIPKVFLDGINELIISDSNPDPEIKARYQSIKARIQDYLKLKKDLTKKSTTVSNEDLQKEIDELERKKQEEISKLPTKPTEVNKKELESKHKSELDAELQVGEYADVTTTTDTEYRLYKSEDGLRYNDENGDLVENSLNTTFFKTATKFNIENLPNETKKKEIEKRYDEEIENAKKVFRESKTRLKKGEQRVIIHQGVEINLNDASLEDLIALRDSTNEQLKEYEEKDKSSITPEDKADIADIELTKKLIVEQIDEVKLKKYPEELRENVMLLREIINEQRKNPIERKVLEEDAPEIGLKKGDTAYFIKGQPYKRLTNAMQVALPDYQYADIDKLNTLLNDFIINKTLTPKRIKAFIQALKDDNLKGVNDKTADALEKLLLDAVTPQPTTSEQTIEEKKAEIERRIQEIEGLLSSDNNSIQQTGTGNLISEARIELQEELKRLKNELNLFNNNKKDTESKKNEIDKKRKDIISRKSSPQEKFEFLETIPEGSIVKNDDGDAVIIRKKTSKRGTESYEIVPLFINEDGVWEENYGGLKIVERKANGEFNINAELPQIFTSNVELIFPTDTKYDAELAAIENQQTSPQQTTSSGQANTTKQSTLISSEAKELITNFIKENSYEDSRVAGNFVDLLKDFFESGKQPAFDPKIITKEAYDEFFAPDSFIRKFKEGVDRGEYYLVGNDVRVYDEDSRIAGEIDLLVATKSGIFIIDIKTGEASKWRNFHKESPNTFSKKNEYTLQQASYATMLEKMSGGKIKVKGIGLLPIERISNKETNVITNLQKPADTYPIYIYEGTDEVNGKKIKKYTKRTDIEPNPLFIVLDRRSVEKEVKQIFGETSEPVYRDKAKKALEKLLTSDFTLDSVKQNYTNTKSKIENWYKNQDIEIPEELTSLLQQLNLLAENATKVKELRKIRKKYDEEVKRKAAELKKLQDKLSSIKNPIEDISQLDTEITEEFIEAELISDASFEKRYNYHEERGKKITGLISQGQINALHVLKASGIISEYEYDSVDEKSSFFDASLIIHQAVKRIQYLNNGLQDKAFASYQNDMFKVLYAESNAQDTLNIFNTFNEALENPGDYLNNLSSLNQILLAKEIEISKAEQNENQKSRLPILEAERNDIETFIKNYKEAYKQEDEQFDIPEDEGQLEEIIFNVNDKYVLKSDPTIQVIVQSFNEETSEVILLKISDNKTFAVTLSNFNNDYIPLENVTDEEEEPLSDEDKDVAKKGTELLKSYINKENYFETLKTKSESSEEVFKKLLESIKNCK